MTQQQQHREQDEGYRAHARSFITGLYKLDRAGRARLKRNAGQTLATARDVYQVFYPLLPHGLSTRQYDTYFLVATMFATVVRHEDQPREDPPRNLGASLHQEKQRRKEVGTSLDRRFTALLDADREQLPFRLRQVVRLLAAQRIAIDWVQLLADLRAWDHEQRFVQRRWAQSYYSPLTLNSSEQEATNQGETV